MTPTVQHSRDVEFCVRERVLRVTINRPQKRNALSLAVLSRLGELFRSFADDERIHVAVVTGAGDRAFAAGGDLAELEAIRDLAAARQLSLHGKAALDAIRYFPTPVVALLNGVALGGGAELALACDIRVATEHATIGLIHARLAITPSWGGSVDLMQVVGRATATSLLARAEVLTASAALALGLVEHVIAADAPLDTSFETYVAAIAQKPRHVLLAIKAAAIAHRRLGRSALEEQETEQFAQTWIHEDHWTAVDSLSLGRKG